MVTTVLYFSLSLITIGAVAGAVLIANYLRKSYPVNFIESYFYYVILMCAFGIYGIWGLIFVKLVLLQITLSENIVSTISYTIPFLGFPFLIMAWYMFLRFCYELIGSYVNKTVAFSYFFFLFFFFVMLGWSIAQTGSGSFVIQEINLIYVFLVLEVILIGWGLIIISLNTPKTISQVSLPKKRYVFITVAFLLLKLISVYIFYHYPVTVPAFILLYFLSVVIPLIYFYSQKDRFIPMTEGDSEISSFNNLIARYGITRREREIIKEVCSGKSNQEIADTLFISLQTVKDHTHRIYLKMEIKSRVQLINMMQLK